MHTLTNSDFEFIGWLHVDSDQVIQPGQTILISGSGIVRLYALWDINDISLSLADVSMFSPPPSMETVYQAAESNDLTREYYDQTQEYAVFHEVTHNIHLEASQHLELGTLSIDGFADVIFNNDGLVRAIIPESFTIATPYLFKLSDAHAPFRSNFDFIGWLHADTDQVIYPGQTILLSGSGVVRLYALWDFNGLNPIAVDRSISMPPSNMEVFLEVEEYENYIMFPPTRPVSDLEVEGYESYIMFPPTRPVSDTEFVPEMPDYHAYITDAYSLVDIESASTLVRVTHAFISGTPRVGSTLTANFSLSSSVSNPIVTFQWQRWNASAGQWVNIAGATGRTFVPTATDANGFVVVRVQGTGANVSTAQHFSDWVQVAPNVSNISNVTISGTLRVGSTLTANVTYTPAISNPTVTFQWQRWNGSTGQWVNIAGATGRTFVPTATDANGFVVVRVQGTGANVSTAQHFSDWVQIAPNVSNNVSNISNVTISGTLRVGSTLTANVTYSPAISNPVVNFQWQRWNGSTGQWVNIAGATGRTFVPTATDANGFVQVRVQGTGSNVSTTARTSASVQIAANLSNITGVTISGTLRVGSTLTANVTYTPAISNPTVTFQWQRWNGSTWVNIAGATGRTFIPTAADANGFVQVRVQGTGVNVSTTARTSAHVQIAANISNITNVTISGTHRVGSTLTANVTYSPAISNPTVNFQWQRWNASTGQWVNISGATGRTYVLATADANTSVRVRVQGTGANVSTAQHFSASVSIAASPSNIANVTISGTPRVGNTLTANVTYSPAISNPTVNFQWQRWNASSGQWVNISGATRQTYVLTTADAGGFVQVRVQGTGVNVTTTARTSAFVQITANLSNITNVTISGTLRVGSTLTANVTYSPAISNPTVNFQWQRWNGSSWVNIAGATGRTFVVTAADSNGFIQVRAQGTGANVSTTARISSWVQIENNARTTLVLIPGLMGSRLYNASGTQIWHPPVVSGILGTFERYLLSDENGRPLHNVTFARRQGEYGAIDIYRDIYRFLRNENNFPRSEFDVLFFTYDWRQSSSHNAILLENQLRGVNNVVFIAHSMGGLVASSYLARSQANRNQVDMLITFGTPFMGSTKAIEGFETGQLLHWAVNLILAGNLRRISENTISGYELLPTSRYGQFIGRFGVHHGLTAYTHQQGWNFIRQRPWGLTSNRHPKRMFADSQAFHASLMVGSNHIANTVNSVYFVGTGTRTSSMAIYTIPLLSSDQPALSHFLFSDGDGTVSARSAANGLALTNSRIITLPGSRGDHTNMVSRYTGTQSNEEFDTREQGGASYFRRSAAGA